MQGTSGEASADHVKDDWWGDMVRMLGFGGDTQTQQDGTLIVSSSSVEAPFPSEQPAVSSAEVGTETAEDEAEAQEGGDTCAPLPTSFPSVKPTLNIPALPPTGPDQQPAMSTRRMSTRWIASLFTPRTARTARNDIARATLPKVVAALKSDRAPEEVTDAGRRLLELCPSHDKVARAANIGALEAIEAAFRNHRTQYDVLVWLLPPLINLSSGDDDAGFERAATLVQLGVLELLCATLQECVSNAQDGDQLSRPEADVRAQVVERSIWALQHLCRRGYGLDDSSKCWRVVSILTCIASHAMRPPTAIIVLA